MEDYQRAVERLDAFRASPGPRRRRPVRATGDRCRAGCPDRRRRGACPDPRTHADRRALLALLPNLRLICQTGRGMPHIDLAECTRRGIVVCTGSGSAYAPAELTLALILASTRCIVADALALRAGTWQTTVGRELHGRTLGIIGYGNIGALVAGYGGRSECTCSRGDARRRSSAQPPTDTRRAGARRPLRAIGCRQRPPQADAGDARARDARHFSLMKPDALFVNTARAGLVEQGALAAALPLGRPGSAAIDVFDEEPATATIRSSRATPCSPRRISDT